MDLYQKTELDQADINTDRLRLRMLNSGDATWIARDIAVPSVHQWLTAPPKPYLLSDAMAFIRQYGLDPRYRVIEWRNAPCGVVSLTQGRMNLPDLGYWLATQAWGQGIMTEAARALINWQFARSHDDIRSGWIIGNIASANVLTKLGFEPDGSVQAHSGFHDKTITVEKVRLRHPHAQVLRAGA